MKILKYILILSLFTMISCGDDEDDTDETLTLIDKVKGNHTGQFENIACSLVQTVNFSDDQSTLDITELTDSTVTAELIFSNNNVQTIFNFNGTASTDSMISVNEFDFDDETYIGNIFLLENGKVKVFLSDECVIFGSAAVTEIFEEN